jgi:predicted XRE-type DNA-binding protein
MIEERDDFALERGTGKVFADLGLPDAEREQLRAVLAAKIGKSLMNDSLSVRDAERLTGCAAADFSCMRRAKIKGFDTDRLMTIRGRLNRKVRVSVSVMPRNLAASSQSAL